MKRVLLFTTLFAWALVARAGVLDDESLRVGGGFGSVQVKGKAYGTVEAFAGVDTVREGPYRMGFEASAMGASDSGADGLGVSGFFNWSAAEDVNLFGRLGVDFGGDSGYLIGAGVGYLIERNMEVRLEWVARQAGSGVQFNLAWYPHVSPYP